MTPNLKKLIRRYRKLERNYQIRQDAAKYSTLVTAKTTQDYPVQRWFHFKEAFSLDLLETLIADWNIDIKLAKKILDPFCGTGTSLLSAQKLAKAHNLSDLQAIGFERNPFMHFVAKTKTSWKDFNLESLTSKTTYLLNGCPKTSEHKLPALSTIKRKDVFPRKILRKILGFRNAVKSLDVKERELLLLGFASVLEDLSGVRKDGRALRLVRKKNIPTVDEALLQAWSAVAEDFNTAANYFKNISTDVVFGDGRTLTPVEENDSEYKDFDIIFYSPPYLNNIDYSEVYKLELWLCGFVNTTDAFRELRLKTFRSHPSIKFTNPIMMRKDKRLKQVKHSLKVLIDALPKDDNWAWRKRLFTGYFDDMYQSLIHQKAALIDGGWIFCVVGNSLHGSSEQPDERVTVASDLLIASIADAIGLEVKAIQIARELKRRTSDGNFLRESIVVLRKPKGEKT